MLRRDRASDAALMERGNGAFHDLAIRRRVSEHEWQPAGGRQRGQSFAVRDDCTDPRMKRKAVVLGEHLVIRPGKVGSKSLGSDLDSVLLHRKWQPRPAKHFEHIQL